MLDTVTPYPCLTLWDSSERINVSKSKLLAKIKTSLYFVHRMLDQPSKIVTRLFLNSTHWSDRVLGHVHNIILD